jgi:hypothetical protein
LFKALLPGEPTSTYSVFVPDDPYTIPAPQAFEASVRHEYSDKPLLKLPFPRSLV